MDKIKKNCAFFMRGGYRKCNTSCGDLHPITLDEDCEVVLTSYSGDVKRGRVCTYFNAGNCWYGSNCRFCHLIRGDPYGRKRKLESKADREKSNSAKSFIEGPPSKRTKTSDDTTASDDVNEDVAKLNDKIMKLGQEIQDKKYEIKDEFKEKQQNVHDDEHDSDAELSHEPINECGAPSILNKQGQVSTVDASDDDDDDVDLVAELMDGIKKVKEMIRELVKNKEKGEGVDLDKQLLLLRDQEQLLRRLYGERKQLTGKKKTLQVQDLTYVEYLNHILKANLEVGSVLNGEHFDVPLDFLEVTYIRYAYKILLSKIYTSISGNKRKAQKSFLILGSSGIGKSTFFGFALAMILQDFTDAHVIISRYSTTPIYYLFTRSSVSVLTIREYSYFVAQKTTWWFLDGGEHGAFLDAKCVTILASSPDEKHYGDYKKKKNLLKLKMPWPCSWDGKYMPRFEESMSSIQLMPMPTQKSTDEEAILKLEECISNELTDMFCKCYKETLNYTDCFQRYQLCGSLPRVIFDPDLSIQSLQREIRSVLHNKQSLDVVFNVSPNDHTVLDRMCSDKLVSSTCLVLSPDSDFSGYSQCSFPSSYICDAVFEAVSKKKKSILMRFLSSEPDTYLASCWGCIFEDWCMEYLCNMKTQLDLIELRSTHGNYSFALRSCIPIIKKKTDPFTDHNLISILSTESHLDAPLLLVPKSKQYGSIDGIVFNGNVVYLLQATRNTRHYIGAKKLDNIISALKNNEALQIHEFIFVWLVPDTENIYDNFTKQKFVYSGILQGSKLWPQNLGLEYLFDIVQMKAKIPVAIQNKIKKH